MSPDVRSSESVPRAWRGRIAQSLSETECRFHADGGLLVDALGRIEACDEWHALESAGRLNGYEVVQLPGHQLIIPGFVDLHVHLPQMEVTGCQEENLLRWLEHHIFPAESRFADPAHATDVSRWFFSELLRNGTTTAAVFLTSHDKATRIAFETAESLGNRVIMGQNLMDRNAPADLIKSAEQMLAESEAHCERWHNADDGRLQYAWMPRFALTSSEELLAGIGALRKRYPDVYLHTHLSEQPSEIAEVQRQFPWAADYTAVYEKFDLLGPKTILAHGVHLSDSELDRIQKKQSALAHCPGSNFFLKSGRFRLLEILRRKVLFGLGSDVGAGPELSMFKVMKDAQYMQGDTLVPLEALFYAATLGGAEALRLADRIGNFAPGKEADFVILDCRGKPGFVRPESEGCAAEEGNGSLQAVLSRMMYLGDDRMIRETWVRGKRVHGRAEASPDALALI